MDAVSRGRRNGKRSTKLRPYVVRLTNGGAERSYWTVRVRVVEVATPVAGVAVTVMV